MLFNSFPFLFVFLPVTYLGVLVLLDRVRSARSVLAWLAVCSFVFVSYWYPSYAWVVAVSILVNYTVGGAIAGTTAKFRKVLFFSGLCINLLLLGHFKYLGFLNSLIVPEAHSPSWLWRSAGEILLPIGISFYTFQQIAFLADIYTGRLKDRPRFSEYALFVLFFPQLIAGPIVHHYEIMPQLATIRERLGSARYVPAFVIPGLALLIIGLAKKVLLADSFGIFADTTFDAAKKIDISFLEAWGGATAYTLQIYFDFSGYSDMALGLGLLFGVRLPVNFFSPYKARSIIDFWRRWHMTLSRFLRDYLYIPLGGNRYGTARRYINLLLTMTIGGLWHGANWTFVLWGMLHGLLLAANHVLRDTTHWRPPAWLAVMATLLLVVFAWVLFRADNVAVAGQFYRAMLGLDGIVLPTTYAGLENGIFAGLLHSIGVRFGNIVYFAGLPQIIATLAALIFVLMAPSSATLLTRRVQRRVRRSLLAPIALAGMACLSILLMFVRPNVTFLYFQF